MRLGAAIARDGRALQSPTAGLVLGQPSVWREDAKAGRCDAYAKRESQLSKQLGA
jgi:hypothetical protein